MRRAAAAAGSGVTEQIAERVDRSVLHRYPAEERSLRPALPAEREPAPRRTGEPADIVVRPRYSQAYRGKLVIDDAVSAVSVEQYRRLAATMHHIQAEQGLRHLMVSSASPREGKTLTIVNLALTLSESYERRVLLIDADLRRPSVHNVFGISNKFGVAHAIQSDPMDIRTSRVCQNLWVLPAGTPDANPMAALASRQMERLLGEATASFDWVLVDAPPFGLVADAALLARLVRAVIVVIAAGSTQYKSVEKAVAELGREYVVGTVLNRVEEGAAPWSEYYIDNNDVIGGGSLDAALDKLAHVRGHNVDQSRS
jgi:capsular exopolysaccharide synthesis family protein